MLATFPRLESIGALVVRAQDGTHYVELDAVHAALEKLNSSLAKRFKARMAGMDSECLFARDAEMVIEQLLHQSD